MERHINQSQTQQIIKLLLVVKSMYQSIPFKKTMLELKM